MIRRTRFMTGLFSLLLATFGSQALADKGGMPNAKSLADFDSWTVACGPPLTTIVSSDKEISNVVLLFSDGTFQKFDDLSGLEFSFDDPNLVVETIYVKAGSLKQRVDGLPGVVGREFDCTSP